MYHSLISNTNTNSYYSSLNEIENSQSYNDLEETYHIVDEIIEHKKKLIKIKSNKIISCNEQSNKDSNLIKKNQNKSKFNNDDINDSGGNNTENLKEKENNNN